MFSSDHGINSLVVLRENEVSHGLAFYASWNQRKVKKLRSVGVSAIHVQHPWLELDRANLRSFARGSGTLVFWPKRNPLVAPAVDADAFSEQLLALPERYHPFTICVSSHDIREGLHLDLRRLGFPLTTAGDLLDQRFAIRFYGLLSQFAYTAGLDVSAHVYASLDAGLPYLLLDLKGFQWHRRAFTGESTEIFDELSVDFPDPVDRRNQEEFRNDLRIQWLDVPPHLMSEARRQLGYDSNESRLRFSMRVWIAFFKHLPSAIRLYFKVFGNR